MTYKGFVIKHNAKGQTIIHNEEGPTPDELSGIYTSTKNAENHLLKYSQEKEKVVVTRNKKSDLEAL